MRSRYMGSSPMMAGLITSSSTRITRRAKAVAGSAIVCDHSEQRLGSLVLRAGVGVPLGIPHDARDVCEGAYVHVYNFHRLYPFCSVSNVHAEIRWEL